MRLPLAHPLLGTWPTIQSCALAGNRTGDPLVHRPVLNPLSYTSQGPFISSCILIHLVVLIECKTSEMKAYRNNLRPWMMLPSFREDIYLLPAGRERGQSVTTVIQFQGLRGQGYLWEPVCSWFTFTLTLGMGLPLQFPELHKLSRVLLSLSAS